MTRLQSNSFIFYTEIKNMLLNLIHRWLGTVLTHNGQHLLFYHWNLIANISLFDGRFRRFPSHFRGNKKKLKNCSHATYKSAHKLTWKQKLLISFKYLTVKVNHPWVSFIFHFENSCNLIFKNLCIEGA